MDISKPYQNLINKKMKNKFIILLFVMFIYCQKKPIDKATNTIKHNIELKGEGMLNGLKIQSIQMEDSTTFKVKYTFTNPFNKVMRITNRFYLNTLLDTIKSKEDLRTEVMSEGEYRTVFENKKFLKN